MTNVTTATRIDKQSYKRIERELMNYHTTKESIKLRRLELSSNNQTEKRFTISFDVAAFATPLQYNSPTERIAVKLADDIQLQKMERVIKAIDFLMDNCDDNIRRFIELRYLRIQRTRMAMEDIASELYISRRSAYYLRDYIIQTLYKLLGNTLED